MEDYSGFYSLFFGFFVSLITCILIATTKTKHSFRVNIDNNPQKIHTEYVPRIGGLAVILGIGSQFYFLHTENLEFCISLFLLSFGIFLIGFVEDLRQNLKPILRLVLCLCISSLIFSFLSVQITHVNINVIDNFLLSPSISFFVTVIAITTLIQSFNIIDGLNGLAILSAKFMIVSIGLISYFQGDFLIMVMSLITLGPLLGILIFNFPLGKIFLGDGGAYFLGIWIAVLVIMLSERNQEVSPFCSLLIVIFPVYETIRSFCRRLTKNISETTLPDFKHFHSIIYKRVNKLNFNYSWQSNSLASLITLMLPLTTSLSAIIFYEQDQILIFLILFYISFKELTFFVLRKTI
ncbi:glycosyltransferase [bacterium]|nr:glycosyltransferase [bacterium]